MLHLMDDGGSSELVHALLLLEVEELVLLE